MTKSCLPYLTTVFAPCAPTSTIPKHHQSLADAILTFSVTIGFGLIVVIYFLIKDRKEDAAIAVEEGKQSKTQRGSSDAVMLEAYRGEKDEGGQPHGMGEMEWGDGEAYKVCALLLCSR